MALIVNLLVPILLLMVLVLLFKWRGTSSRIVIMLKGTGYAVIIGLFYGLLRVLLFETEMNIGNDIVKSVFFSLFAVGVAGEIGKVILLRLYAMPYLDFENRFDGVIWGIAVSVGLSFGQILLTYLVVPFDEVMEMRLFTEMLVSIGCGVIMGYFSGLVIEEDNSYTGLYISFIFAVALHATYDFTFTMGASIIFKIVALLLLFSTVFMFIKATLADDRITAKLKKRYPQISSK